MVLRMRIVLTLIASAAILAGAYAYTFGVPDRVSEVLGMQTGTAPVAQATAGGPRAGGRRGGGATTVVLAELEKQPYTDILRAVGSAAALQSADVVANASGEIIESNLSANQNVEVGDILVRLDARAQSLNLDIAQATLGQAQDNLTRYERLRGNGNSTITDVTLSEARVAMRLAEAQVGLAQVALDDRTVRATISGKLGLSEFEVGDILVTDANIVSIDNADTLLVTFELPERSIAILASQNEISASTPTFTGRIFKGEIVSFDSRIDSVTRSVTVKARIDNPDSVLWPGMTFAVRMIKETLPLAVVPSTAITWSRDGSSIWIDNAGTAEQVRATILYRRNDQIWIDADIPPATMIVTEGAHKLRAGSKITTADRPRSSSATASDNNIAAEEPT